MPKKITNFSDSAEPKRYEDAFAAFILSTPDFNEYAERIEKWLEEHPHEDDIEVAYKAVKDEAIAEELEKITESNPTRQIYSDLHRAVYNGELGMAIDLVDNKGADVNQRDEVNFGETPLMIAIRQGDLEMIKILLDRGANPMIADSSAGLTSFDCAGPEIREFISNYNAKTTNNKVAGHVMDENKSKNNLQNILPANKEKNHISVLAIIFYAIVIGIPILIGLYYEFFGREEKLNRCTDTTRKIETAERDANGNIISYGWELVEGCVDQNGNFFPKPD